jgi:hypothetical protein
MEIWNQRPHYSEVSGKYLGEEPMAYFFAHVCSKGAHPKLKFEKRNIMLMTLVEHIIWDTRVPEGKMWDKVKDRKEEMQKLSASFHRTPLLFNPK